MTARHQHIAAFLQTWVCCRECRSTCFCCPNCGEQHCIVMPPVIEPPTATRVECNHCGFGITLSLAGYAPNPTAEAAADGIWAAQHLPLLHRALAQPSAIRKKPPAPPPPVPVPAVAHSGEELLLGAEWSRDTGEVWAEALSRIKSPAVRMLLSQQARIIGIYDCHHDGCVVRVEVAPKWMALVEAKKPPLEDALREALNWWCRVSLVSADRVRP
jgi:hypothetical protein